MGLGGLCFRVVFWWFARFLGFGEFCGGAFGFDGFRWVLCLLPGGLAVCGWGGWPLGACVCLGWVGGFWVVLFWF